VVMFLTAGISMAVVLRVLPRIAVENLTYGRPDGRFLVDWTKWVMSVVEGTVGGLSPSVVVSVQK
jgi:hypothetical protein